MTEKRLHPRVPYSVTFECRRFFDDQGLEQAFSPGESFQVENLSPGGMQVTSTASLPIGAAPRFTLYLEQIPYSAMCRVRWRRKTPAGNRYGFEFLDTSTASTTI